jgi:hypothetical protein
VPRVDVAGIDALPDQRAHPDAKAKLLRGACAQDVTQQRVCTEGRWPNLLEQLEDGCVARGFLEKAGLVVAQFPFRELPRQVIGEPLLRVAENEVHFLGEGMWTT